MAQINKSSDYFNTVLYTGDGNSTKSISGVGFQLDWNWTKCRSTAYNHIVMDSVRGFGTGKKLSTNVTTEEGSASNVEDGGGYITTTSSDGYDLGTTDVANNVHFNKSGETYASWNWLAGGTGASNTDGDITSTVSANTTSGFSIVSYTGTGADATVGHGLGVTPKIIFWKRRDNTAGAVNWIVQSTLFGNQTKLVLNTTEAFSTNATFSQTNNWDSSTIDLKTYEGQNHSSATYIAYCFAEKKGFSKFGSYTGNGSSDGTFVYTGFKPAFVMIKRTNSTQNWYINDNKRNPNNDGSENFLQANLSDAEGSTTVLDFLSNGIKLRQSGDGVNASGSSYIYMAFASEPLVGSNNVCATAR